MVGVKDQPLIGIILISIIIKIIIITLIIIKIIIISITKIKIIIIISITRDLDQ